MLSSRYWRLLPLLFSPVLIARTSVLWAQSIALERVDGIYKVPCKVNGLQLKFILDTGSSNVSLSLSEAIFMLKNGYLSETDFTGTEKYRIANGEIHEGYTLNLREIEVGGRILYNIKASIVQTMDAPLLLGQSALGQLGKFQIDYESNTLHLSGSMGEYRNEPFSQHGPSDDSFESIDRLVDIDGNRYTPVHIGTQVWMKENLRTTRYRNGDLIPRVVDEDEWYKLSTGAYCYYDNDITNKLNYGNLYNWYAVYDSRCLCPIGWHVPTKLDWIVLINYLGGSATAGGKLKASGSRYWNYPNEGASNDSEFSALPGGYRMFGSYYFVKSIGGWWSISAFDDNNSWALFLDSSLENIDWLEQTKTNGMSVRCVKD